VIDMGFLSVIRRWALRDKMPIREIARRTGLSRNTIKKSLREGAVGDQAHVDQVLYPGVQFVAALGAG
jgi:IS30 family transposase